MTQKLIINVNAEKPLSEYGDRHVILYNKSKNEYFVTTREQFLSQQEKEIAELRADFEKTKKELENFRETIRKEYSAFVKNYKETNAKLIEMVRTVVEEK